MATAATVNSDLARRDIIGLGVTQIICWGVSFYLIGVFGERIAADLGWSARVIHGGFSVSLLIMGLVSPFVGRMIDRYGGRPVLTGGSALLAATCLWLSQVETIAGYFAVWAVMGVAMRCTLYDAAFAALARIAGPLARRPISQITLLGGLAATCFWPLGHWLSEALGWRGALMVYAGLALATALIHVRLPDGRFTENATEEQEAAATRGSSAVQRKRALLFVTIVMLGNALHAGMSSHLISILGQLGLGASLAVAAASMRGVGQSTGRLIEVLSGSRLHPIDLNLIAVGILPVAFAIGLASDVSVVAAFAFTFAYGVGTGLLTITRGTLPLVLFDSRTYGAQVGKMLVPSFFASAASPFLFAVIIEWSGARGALVFALLALGVMLGASVMLSRLRPTPTAPSPEE